VLGADVVVPELQGLAKRKLEHLLGAGRERDVSGGHVRALADKLLDVRSHVIERDVEALERLGGDTVLLTDEPEQEMLGTDVVLIELLGLFLGVHDNASGLLGEPLEHVKSLLSGTPRGRIGFSFRYCYSTPPNNSERCVPEWKQAGCHAM